MTPLVCALVKPRQKKKTESGKVRVKTQVLWTLNGVNPEDVDKIIFAYEPVWAIGQSPKVLDADYVDDMHQFHS
jgi:triosephosphate isomerase (TIM)